MSWRRSLGLLVVGSLVACASTTPPPDSLANATANAKPQPTPTVTASAPPAVTTTATVAKPEPPPEAKASVEIVPARGVVAAKKDDELAVRVRVKGLPLEDKKRPPINVALVVDASGSMDGAGIEEARNACAAMLDELKDGDAFSIVTFGSQPKIVVEASRVSDKTRAAAKAAIAAIKANGTTDMAGGLRVGIEQAKALIDPNGINRVVLVGDGVPNDPAPLGGLADQARGLRIPITSLGLGPEFDETQMAMLAQRSSGSFHFIKDSTSVAKVFKDEITRMERLVAKNARVELTPGPGVTLDEVIGLPVSRNGKKMVIQLGDLTEGKARDVMLRVKIAGKPDNARVELLDAVLHFTPASGGVEKNVPEFLAVKASSDAGALKEVNKEIEHQAVRLRVADAIVKAMALARGGDVTGARKLLDAASKLASEGAKKYEDKELEGRVKEITQLKKTVASLAPPPDPFGGIGMGMGGARGGMAKRPSALDASPAAAMGMRSTHGAAMKELQGF